MPGRNVSGIPELSLNLHPSRERDEEIPSSPTFLGYNIPAEFLPFHYPRAQPGPGDSPLFPRNSLPSSWNFGKESNIPTDTSLVELTLSHLDHSRRSLPLRLPPASGKIPEGIRAVVQFHPQNPSFPALMAA